MLLSSLQQYIILHFFLGEEVCLWVIWCNPEEKANQFHCKTWTAIYEEGALNWWASTGNPIRPPDLSVMILNRSISSFFSLAGIV